MDFKNIFQNAVSGFIISLITELIIVIAFKALTYVASGNDVPSDTSNTNHIPWLSWYFWVAINTAIVYALTLFIFRGLISPLIFMVVSLLYSAGVKYFTGSLLLGMDVHDSIWIIIFAMYITGMTFFSSMLMGNLQTAITFRTTDDD